MVLGVGNNLKSDNYLKIFIPDFIIKKLEMFKFVRTSKFLANFSEGKANFFCKFEP